MRKSASEYSDFTPTRVSSKTFREKPRKEGEQYSRNEKKKDFQRQQAQRKRDI